MTASKERRRARRRLARLKAAQAARQQQSPDPNRPTWSRRLVDNPLTLLLGLLATLLAFFLAWRDAYHEPVISAPLHQDPAEPFALPFEIKNVSWLFTMIDTTLKCSVEYLEFAQHQRIIGIDFGDVTKISIPSEHTGNFRCLIAGSQGRNIFKMPDGSLIKGKMHLSVEYKTLWIHRESDKVEFTWYDAAKPARWIEGPIVD